MKRKKIKRTINFLQMALHNDFYWLVRDKDGTSWLFRRYPRKHPELDIWTTMEDDGDSFYIFDAFDAGFGNWNDEMPVTVEGAILVLQERLQDGQSRKGKVNIRGVC